MRLFVAVFVGGCVIALIRGGLRIDTTGSLDDGLVGFSARGTLGSEPLGLGDVVGSLLLAQLVAGGRLLLAVETGPLHRRYLRAYGERPLRFRPLALDQTEHEIGASLPDFGLHRSAAIGDLEGDVSMVFDLYQSTNRVVTVAVARNTGSVSVLSELDDGRVVVTVAVTTVPNERLVVNVVPHGSLPQLLAAHRNLLESLIGRRARPIPSSPEVFVRSLHLEQESFVALGPVVGSFLDLTGARTVRLAVGLDPDTLRERSFGNDLSTRFPPLRLDSFDPEPVR